MVNQTWGAFQDNLSITIATLKCARSPQVTAHKFTSNAGVFLAICPKTQGPKNSNSRKIFPKLKDFWPENSRNRQILGQFSAKTQILAQKNAILDEIFQKLKDFLKTQGQNLSKTQETGNSTITQCRKSAPKNPELEPYP